MRLKNIKPMTANLGTQRSLRGLMAAGGMASPGPAQSRTGINSAPSAPSLAGGGSYWSQPEEKQALMSEDDEANFTCPITQEIMVDPVIASDGHTYDRHAITEWLRTHDTSPTTNMRLPNKNLIPNH